MSTQPPPRPDGTNPEYLLLGEILRPHGIRGELRMRILTDYPERITSLKTVYLGKALDDSPEVTGYNVQHMRMHQAYGLLKLKGVDDRNQADHLRQLLVMVRIEDAVPLEDDEIYLYQLIGLQVKTENGEALGTITEVLETGANDVYVLASPDYGEILIPITDETLIETDIDTGIVIVRLPDGLLPG